MSPMDYHRPADDDLRPAGGRTVTDDPTAATAMTVDHYLAAIERNIFAGYALLTSESRYLLDRLRAVTALVDEWIARVGHMRERAEKAERQVAAVRALHLPEDPPDEGLCMHCGVPWPCPTLYALDSAQPQDTPTVVRRTPTEPNRTTLPAQPQDTARRHLDAARMLEAAGWSVAPSFPGAQPQDTPDDSEWQALADAWTPAARAAAAGNIRSALRLKDSPLVRARLDYLATPQDTPPDADTPP